MAMDEQQKHKVEAKLVAGLVVVLLLVVSMGPAKQFFRTGPTGSSPAGTQPDAEGGVGVSLLGEAQRPVETQAGPVTEGHYTAQVLRDPLESRLPEPEQLVVQGPQPDRSGSPGMISGSGPGTSEPSAPAFTVQGIFWGGGVPQAIIDHDVYGIGDDVGGAVIRTIDQSGVTVAFQDRLVVVRLPALVTGGVWREGNRTEAREDGLARPGEPGGPQTEAGRSAGIVVGHGAAAGEE